jgi:ribosomal-protein-alanine N-acetyltransferase
VDEAHVTTFATRGAWRRQGIGERLLLALLDLARAHGAREATLEVRPSNTAARRLYEKYGFRNVGVRPRYYSDNHEDALIMTTEPLDGREMRVRLITLREALARRREIEVGPDGRPIGRPPGPDGRRLEGPAADPGPTAASSIPEPGDPGIIRPSRVTRKTP